MVNRGANLGTTSRTGVSYLPYSYANAQRNIGSRTVEHSKLVFPGTVNSPLSANIVGRFLEESTHVALSGTDIRSGDSWRRYLYPIFRDLLSTGLGHATQYQLKVESESPLTEPYEDSEQLKEKTGELVREALEISGLTRDQFAALLGVKRQSVYNWLKSIGGISPKNLENLHSLVEFLEQIQHHFENPRGVASWLTSPTKSSLTPLDLLTNSEFNRVKGLLLRRGSTRKTSTRPARVSPYVPRRVSAHGEFPNWEQPFRELHYDPEEEQPFSEIESDEVYREDLIPNVVGLALA